MVVGEWYSFGWKNRPVGLGQGSILPRRSFALSLPVATGNLPADLLVRPRPPVYQGALKWRLKNPYLRQLIHPPDFVFRLNPLLLFFPDSLPPDIECDLFKGRWVLDRRSLYMNSSCYVIPDLKNCIKLGTPDTDFLNWKWKPDGYDLPRFNPKGFLSMVQGKKMRFIGDSVAENHMKSLICLFSMEDEAHHPYAFHVSGPSNVASPNWGDLINSSW
ncbi:unnamed protein product [Arabidopsis halleri]